MKPPLEIDYVVLQNFGEKLEMERTDYSNNFAYTLEYKGSPPIFNKRIFKNTRSTKYNWISESICLFDLSGEDIYFAYISRERQGERNTISLLLDSISLYKL